MRSSTRFRVSTLELLESVHVDDKDCCSADLHLHRIRHVNFAGFDDRRQRADLFSSRMTACSNNVENAIDVPIRDSGEDRGVLLAQETTSAFEVRDAISGLEK